MTPPLTPERLAELDALLSAPCYEAFEDEEASRQAAYDAFHEASAALRAAWAKNEALRKVWFPADQTIGCELCGWVDWQGVEENTPNHSDECPVGFLQNRAASSAARVAELEAELATAREKLDFLESKGITVGLMKTSDKQEPYLSYLIRGGSQLDDMPTLRKLLDVESERDTLAARLAEAVELLRDMAYDDPCSFDHHGHCQAHLWFGDGRCPHARAAAFLARTEPAK